MPALASEGPIALTITFFNPLPLPRMNPPMSALSPVAALARVEIFSRGLGLAPGVAVGGGGGGGGGSRRRDSWGRRDGRGRRGGRSWGGCRIGEVRCQKSERVTLDVWPVGK